MWERTVIGERTVIEERGAAAPAVLAYFFFQINI